MAHGTDPGRDARAIFLDKDGTLVDDVPYSADPHRLRFLRGAAAALRLWADAGYRLIVISNQSGVARGFFLESALGPVEARLRAMAEEAGASLAGFYYCPHYAGGTVAKYARICVCRKPEPGLLLRAARECKVDLAASWMIGDRREDVEAGRRAGCRTVWIRKEDPEEASLDGFADFVCRGILEAAQETLWRDGLVLPR